MMGVFGFSMSPKVHAWLARTKALPPYDEVHGPLVVMLKSFGHEVDSAKR